MFSIKKMAFHYSVVHVRQNYQQAYFFSLMVVG